MRHADVIHLCYCLVRRYGLPQKLRRNILECVDECAFFVVVIFRISGNDFISIENV